MNIKLVSPYTSKEASQHQAKLVTVYIAESLPLPITPVVENKLISFVDFDKQINTIYRVTNQKALV